MSIMGILIIATIISGIAIFIFLKPKSDSDGSYHRNISNTDYATSENGEHQWGSQKHKADSIDAPNEHHHHDRELGEMNRGEVGHDYEDRDDRDNSSQDTGSGDDWDGGADSDR